MLNKLRAENFRSLASTEFIPTGLNLLVGPNNAGKTNLCCALRFMSLSASTNLENASLMTFGETWNIRNVYVDSCQITLEVECTLRYLEQDLDYVYQLVLQAPKRKDESSPALRLLEESLKVTGGVFRKTLLLENKGGQARMLHEEEFVAQLPNSPLYVETRCGDEATMLSQLYELENNPRATLFKRYLRSWLYFNLVPEALRSPQVLRDPRFLRHDGANLTHVLFGIHNEKPRLERKLLSALKPFEPKVELLSFSSPDADHVYLFLEDEKENRFGTRSISDGTMRFLGMACVILFVQDAAKDANYSPLVMIEEPENGLYVGNLKALIDKIDPSGVSGQFVFTSQSPYFIDLFDAHLEGVHVVKPGIPSSKLAKPDRVSVNKFLSEMSLGEQHFRELLG